MNIADYLLETGEDQHLALVSNQVEYTYQDLKDATACLAYSLLEHNLKPGERVGILAENSLFWVAAYLAILKLQGVVVPFATVSTPEDVRLKQDFVRCKVIFADRRSSRRFAQVLPVDVPLILEDALKSSAGWGNLPSLDGRSPDEDAALMFTSGTTGKPRAVRVTARNLQANTESIIQYLRLDQDERVMVVLPFYYCFGASLLHTHLRAGGSLVLCNTFAYPETTLDAIEKLECTGFAGVPSTYQTLLRNSSLPRRKLKSLKKVQQAGGKLQTVLLEELIAALPESEIYVMYGQTEATARLSYLPPQLLPTRLGSIGKGISGVTLQVLNAHGEPVQPGEVGEIIAWGENISPGYLDDPQATAEKFAGGCLHTGDLATVDEDGFIYIVDRKNDFIKCLGHRVSSQEVEAAILQIPEVVSAAAIGVPDEALGEAIVVFVTLRRNARLHPEDILAHCRQHLARHMIPKEVRILDNLPMNAHGKVVKSSLKELFTHSVSTH